MRQAEVRPHLLVARTGGASSLVRDRNRPGMVGRRAGYIEDPTIIRSTVLVRWLTPDGKPGRTERVAVHRLIDLGETYTPPPQHTFRWIRLDDHRSQGEILFAGLFSQPVARAKRRPPRRRVKPFQLTLPL